MSPKIEQVKPAAFSPAEPEPAVPPPAAAHSAATSWVVPALAALVVIALFVVFGLPRLFDNNGEAAGTTGQLDQRATPSQTPPPARAKEPPEEASPWSDAQLARLRKEAQDVLGVLLESQTALEEIGVEQWANDAFEQAKTLAREGDQQYRERQFTEAKASYDKALSAMEALLDSAPSALQTRLELAAQAIEAGAQQAALDALTIAELIAPSEPAVATLIARANALEQLLPLLAQASEAEKSGDLATAQQLLEQAAGVDPAHQKVASELARVRAAHTREQFNRAMSTGYTALDENRFSDARTAFRRAAKLVPGSAEAASALQDLDTTETSWQLTRLQQRGQQYEQAEQWQKAVATYNQALETDPNLLFAQQGLQRSRARAQLDKEFRTAIEQPQRLSDATVAQAIARKVDYAAASISPRGPVLEKQLATLRVLLQQAGAKIAVTLRSDGLTEVILRKVSRLGQFREKTMTLRPGTYTATGSRKGYRDVRQTFTITHDMQAYEVTVVCTEAI